MRFKVDENLPTEAVNILTRAGRPYVSPIVTSPTWLEIVVLADAMIKTTGDYHHQFLEGVRVLAACGDVQAAEFLMGS
jgi:hypothetical protein